MIAISAARLSKAPIEASRVENPPVARYEQTRQLKLIPANKNWEQAISRRLGGLTAPASESS